MYSKTCYLWSLFRMATCLVRPLQKYTSFTVTVLGGLLPCKAPFEVCFFMQFHELMTYYITPDKN